VLRLTPGFSLGSAEMCYLRYVKIVNPEGITYHRPGCSDVIGVPGV